MAEPDKGDTIISTLRWSAIAARSLSYFAVCMFGFMLGTKPPENEGAVFWLVVGVVSGVVAVISGGEYNRIRDYDDDEEVFRG